ncbi:glypican-5b isoform X2 [Electrophorus electricus]|uniref:glypican-5b isoform X2 n=1 Tax=Electrophorus electricus TaxID=8005 RepID=UPI0015CFACE4|nr:glypican-5b isoform X2 [Electrophorus electricus]
MFRKILPRVWICWIFVTFASTWGIYFTGAHSCHEVKTAFQLRHIGPLRWVPETAATDADLQICKHQGPTCCTRKMEQSYDAAARRDTLQNILSYSFELKYLILGHASAYRDTFYSLLSFTLNHTLSLFDLAYEPIAREARPLVITLYSDLALYLYGDAGISIESSVHHFYDVLFPLVYRHLVNPGLRSSSWSAEGAECLRATRPDVNPFGPHPQVLAQGLAQALAGGRALARALAAGADVLNATETVGMARECGRALVRMHYCPHCRGLTLIRPCGGLCLNVMRGCLAGLAELQAPWSRYVALLEGLSAALAGGHELELALLGIRERINDAILSAQLHGPHLSAVVDKVCGPLTESVSSTRADGPPTSTLSTVKLQHPIPPASPAGGADPGGEQHGHVALTKRSLPLKPSKNDKPRSLKKLSKEFMGYIQRYKAFFSTLPELLCEGEMVVDDYTCWGGEDVVESYTDRVVGSGLLAQRHNPEMKVRGVDPVLVEAKERLEQFNQGIWHETGLGVDLHEQLDAGSGNTMETSGECDDEDGCQGSGEDEDAPGGPLPSFQPPDFRARPGMPASAAARPEAASPLLLSLPLLPLLLLSCLGRASA